MHNGGMKRACLMLFLVWIALQSALVQAHVVAENVHLLVHTQHVGDIALGDTEPDGENPCGGVVCTHLLGVLAGVTVSTLTQSSAPISSHVPALISVRAADDIERPKWLCAALCAAGI